MLTLLLRVRDQHFRIVAENAPGVIYLCNNDEYYSMLFISDRVEEMTGYSADDFLTGRIHFVDLFFEDDVVYIRQAIDEALAAHKSFHITYRIRHRDGDIRWIDEVGIGVYQDDVLIMMEGFLCDVTQRKKSEDELLKIAEENNRIFNNSITLNAVTGSDGYFKKLNPVWSRVFGWSIEELQSKPFLDFVHPDDVTITKETFETIKQGNEITDFENRYRCKDGSYRWLLWTSAYDEKCDIIYASASDITTRKKTEEELQQSSHDLHAAALKLQHQNKQLDEFAHIVSHNLRSPVKNIQALISFINPNSSIDDYQLIFDKLRNVAVNLNETMNELMDTMQIKKNVEIERTTLRFSEILNKVVQSLEGELIKANASLDFNFAVASIEYPKTYLESIIQNFLSNAIKYKSPDRPLTIHFESCTTEEGRIQLRVQDNGLGIDLTKFGDKLFGLHKTFHENPDARGVGLFLTKTQIETLGGTIEVESSVNKGTTFIVTF